MKKQFQLSLATLLVALACSANASSASEEIDDSKFCFYNSLKYSVGAKMDQEGKVMACTKGDNRGTRWEEVKPKAT